MLVGIMIIGSLLWDNGQRDVWRRSHLRVEERVRVKAPIRYGRRSLSRGNTFTMTFGTNDDLGQAVLVPCATVIGNLAGLAIEAESLWKAESTYAAANSIGASWGCVGVMCRAESERAGWFEGWADYFRSRASSVSPVDDKGIVRIPWPVTTAVGNPVNIDVILATVTKAEAKRPTVIEIADAWVDQQNGHERYFFENVRHGIRTPDDGLIWKRIEERMPCWLKGETYAEAITILQAEVAQSGLKAQWERS